MGGGRGKGWGDLTTLGFLSLIIRISLKHNNTKKPQAKELLKQYFKIRTVVLFYKTFHVLRFLVFHRNTLCIVHVFHG